MAFDPFPGEVVAWQLLVDGLRQVDVFSSPPLRFQPFRFQPGIHSLQLLMVYWLWNKLVNEGRLSVIAGPPVQLAVPCDYLWCYFLGRRVLQSVLSWGRLEHKPRRRFRVTTAAAIGINNHVMHDRCSASWRAVMGY